MKTSISSKLSIALLACVIAGLSTSALANESGWARQHPRRPEVNARLANQHRRIHREVKEGEMSRGQAAALHKEERQIRQEQRDMARQDGGHITKAEQKVLNQQENRVSRQIGQ